MESPTHSITDKYIGLELVGSGNFGQVYLATQRLVQTQVVIKRIQKGFENHRIENEIKAGDALRGVPSVAQYYESFESKNSYWLVFEYIEGCDLFNYMEQTNFQAMPEEVVKNIFRQLLNALEQMHGRCVYHKDIKLENIMYNQFNEEATFIDLGLSTIGNTGLSRDFCGSKEYSCPEVRAKKTFNPEKADIWSLGIVAFALLFGAFPFSPRDFQTALNTGVHPIASIPNGKVSEEARKFVNSMIQISPNNRASIKELQEHAWLAEKKGVKRMKQL